MDDDNPLSGIIGMVVLISVLPMILQMLSGLTGGAQGGQGGLVPGTVPGSFTPTQAMRVGGFNLSPGRDYSTGQGRFNTPVDLSFGSGMPGGPITFNDMAYGQGSLFNAMYGARR